MYGSGEFSQAFCRYETFGSLFFLNFIADLELMLFVRAHNARCFFSLSAVYGSTFLLNCGSLQLLFDAANVDHFVGVRCSEGDVRASALVIGAAHWHAIDNDVKSNVNTSNDAKSSIVDDELHLCVCVTSRALTSSEPLSMIVVPPNNSRSSTIFALQLDAAMNVVPADLGACLFVKQKTSL